MATTSGSDRGARASRLWVALAAALAIALAGCAQKPTLRIHHAELRSASFQGVGLDLYVQAHNPNSYDVQIRNVRARVILGGRYPLPPMAFSPFQWLPAGEKTLVRVPILIPYGLVPRLLAETVTSPVIRYRVQGSADVTAVRLLGIERDNYPLDQEAAVRRADLVAAAARSF